MLNFKIVKSVILFIFIIFCFSQKSYGTLKNSTTGADVPVCSSTGTFMTANGDCRHTPTKYEVNIFEMGLCTNHPFTDDGTKTDLVTMNKTSCTTTFLATDQTNGFAVDIATGIGGSLALDGTNTRPANGTYGYPYIILGKNFTINVAATASNGNTYYGKSDGTLVTVEGNSSDRVDPLTNFSGGECVSGYVGATIPIGTIDAFLTNAALERSHHTEFTNPNCDKNGKLVGIINLTTPFTITQNTLKLQFNFTVTDYGVNLQDTNNNSLPDSIGSAPFSGSFTITDAPQQ